ncbi:FHA domain-containing protein [Evansella sp. LMS18]|uniref:FHA domain-containing protein n=1 Tax=Evansella sp. LMS18 TaxID=2924033 RepID=UPI0020D17EA4|nr:FHA domain-containing protein [Evansella sp. LMS18]UTR12091.1 FHA domain-containing protein [Evansella sp. LMS18]
MATYKLCDICNHKSDVTYLVCENCVGDLTIATYVTENEALETTDKREDTTGGLAAQKSPDSKQPASRPTSTFQHFKIVNQDENIEIQLPIAETIIGREGDVETSYFETCNYISRRHLSIKYKDEHYVISDLNSHNGSYLNNRRLNPEEEYPLTEGDTIKIADKSFNFQKSL